MKPPIGDLRSRSGVLVPTLNGSTKPDRLRAVTPKSKVTVRSSQRLPQTRLQPSSLFTPWSSGRSSDLPFHELRTPCAPGVVLNGPRLVVQRELTSEDSIPTQLEQRRSSPDRRHEPREARAADTRPRGQRPRGLWTSFADKSWWQLCPEGRRPPPPPDESRGPSLTDDPICIHRRRSRTSRSTRSSSR